jgi:hypothetical protein
LHAFVGAVVTDATNATAAGLDAPVGIGVANPFCVITDGNEGVPGRPFSAVNPFVVPSDPSGSGSAPAEGLAPPVGMNYVSPVEDTGKNFVVEHVGNVELEDSRGVVFRGPALELRHVDRTRALRPYTLRCPGWDYPLLSSEMGGNFSD